MTFKIRNKETKLFIQENSGCNKMEDRTFNEEKEANEFLKIFKIKSYESTKNHHRVFSLPLGHPYHGRRLFHFFQE